MLPRAEGERVSVQASEWVWKHSTAQKSGRLVLLAVAWHADACGDQAWPSVARLAQLTRLSERQVRRHLRELERSGELAWRADPVHGRIYSLPAVQKAVQKQEG